MQLDPLKAIRLPEQLSDAQEGGDELEARVAKLALENDRLVFQRSVEIESIKATNVVLEGTYKSCMHRLWLRAHANLVYTDIGSFYHDERGINASLMLLSELFCVPIHALCQKKTPCGYRRELSEKVKHERETEYQTFMETQEKYIVEQLGIQTLFDEAKSATDEVEKLIKRNYLLSQLNDYLGKI